MNFLVVGDLHGEMPEIYFKNYNAIIAPGDFCSSNETRKLMFENLKKRLDNPKYDGEWYELVGKRRARELINKSIADGRFILERLNSLGVPVYTVPGNNDWFSDKDSKWDYLKKNHFNDLIKGLPNIISVHEKRVDLSVCELIGYGLSSGPEIPQYAEDLRRLKRNELSKKKRLHDREFSKLSSLFKSASKPVIFLSHNVPFNSDVDAINNPSSPRNGQHFGSLIARELIDKHQPLICIGGHMHEYFTSCDLGKTKVVNAGYGSKVNVFIEVSIKGIKRLEFHKGI